MARTGPLYNEPQTEVYTIEHNGEVFEVEGPAGASPEQLQAFVQGGTKEPAPDAPTQMVDADTAPPQAATQMSPEDEAVYVRLAHTADAATLRKFQADKGFTSDPEALDAFVADRDKANAAGTPVDYTHAYTLPKVAETDTAGALGRGALDTLLFGAPQKIGALVAGAEAKLTGGEFGDAYSRMLDANNAVANRDEEDHPWARVSGQLIGGLAIPSGLEGVGLRAGTETLRAGGTIAEARAAARIAVRNRAAAIGGGYGAAHGIGSGDTLEDVATGAVTEGLTGAASGVAAAGIGAYLGRAQRQPLTEGQRVGAAAQRIGVDVLPADVAGPATRRLTSAAAQAPVSAAPIIQGGQRAVTQAQGVRDRMAALIGTALNPEAAGNRATQGADSFIARTGGRANALFRNAEAGAQGVNVTPTEAIRALDRNIRELSDTPGGAAGLARLEGLRDSFAEGQFSVQGVRRMRTALRDEFTEAGLRGSDLERRVNQVVNAANDDVVASLNAAGRPGVARQFQVADRYWRNRVETIDNTLAPIIGKNGDASGETVVKNLQAAMKGDNRRFASFLNAIPQDERGDVRASLIGRLGRSTKGAQNDEGDAFSLATFLSNWDDVGETAKTHLFGLETRAAFNDLATVASGARQTAAYANRSNTSGGIWGNIGVAAGVGAASPIAAVSALIAQYGGGRLLASPRFARWLARAPRSNNATPAYVERLTRIARAEPAIANEVLALQQRLTNAFLEAPTRLAAQEPVDEDNGINRDTIQNERANGATQP